MVVGVLLLVRMSSQSSPHSLLDEAHSYTRNPYLLTPMSHLQMRVPLKNFKLPGTAYGFLEYASDLGSGRELNGNPTEFYRKPGRGMSYGVGVKTLGACRFEYARDCNAGSGTFLVNFGERF